MWAWKFGNNTKKQKQRYWNISKGEKEIRSWITKNTKKTKESRIKEQKNFFFKKKKDNLHVLPTNILTRFFKEFKKYIKMTINNI